jgi:hypothetical protein
VQARVQQDSFVSPIPCTHRAENMSKLTTDTCLLQKVTQNHALFSANRATLWLQLGDNTHFNLIPAGFRTTSPLKNSFQITATAVQLPKATSRLLCNAQQYAKPSPSPNFHSGFTQMKVWICLPFSGHKSCARPL